MDIQRISRTDPARLRELHRELFGCDHPVPNPGYLRRKITWQLQAQAEGGLPEAARERALAIARNVQLRGRARAAADRGRTTPDRAVTTQIAPMHDPRLPMPGSFLVKDFKGRTIVVKVLDDGFEYDNRRFASLSAIAREITGTRWNGFLFFGCAKETPRGR